MNLKWKNFIDCEINITTTTKCFKGKIHVVHKLNGKTYLQFGNHPNKWINTEYIIFFNVI